MVTGHSIKARSQLQIFLKFIYPDILESAKRGLAINLHDDKYNGNYYAMNKKQWRFKKIGDNMLSLNIVYVHANNDSHAASSPNTLRGVAKREYLGLATLPYPMACLPWCLIEQKLRKS